MFGAEMPMKAAKTMANRIAFIDHVGTNPANRKTNSGSETARAAFSP